VTSDSWFVSSTAQIKQRQQIEIKMETIQLLEVQQNSELLYICKLLVSFGENQMNVQKKVVVSRVEIKVRR